MINPFTMIEERFNKIEQLLLEIKARPAGDHTAPRKDFGDIKVACEVTSLSKSTIYRLVSERQIPHFQKRGRIYFSRKELTEWIIDGRRKCATKVGHGL